MYAVPLYRSETANEQSVAKVAKTAAETLLPRLSAETRRAVEMASEPGASNWLTALPSECYNLTLHKGAFRDALCLRYHWPSPMLPSHCVFNAPFHISHALSCPTGGIPSIRHNELRDSLASLMDEVSSDVTIEPQLQPLTNEVFAGRTTS